MGALNLAGAFKGLGTALDGKKNWIVSIGVLLAGLYHLATGRDVYSSMVLLFTFFGWNEELGSGLAQFATIAAPLIFAAWGSIDKLIKGWKEYRAGARPGEVFTDVGAVKKAIADGVIPSVSIVPPDTAVAPRVRP